jgi:phage major head subunit gpT-like protein
MTAQRGNFGDLLAPGFREIYFERFNRYPDEYTKIVNVQDMDRQYIDDSDLSGFGTVPEKTEGVGISYDDPIQGYDKRYTASTYALGFRVTREMWEDDLYGKMKKMPKALGASMRYTIEVDGANLYNRAFNSSYTGGDGIELCSTVHPLTGGGTEQNELTTAADLSETSLEQALIDIAATTDDRGLTLALKPRKLLVSPTNWVLASKLLKSTQEPGSAQNAINPFMGMFELVVNHYMTAGSDDWFILCDDHQVNFIFRSRPNFEQDNDFDTEDAKFKARARWVTGFSGFRGIFGSPGA